MTISYATACRIAKKLGIYPPEPAEVERRAAAWQHREPISIANRLLGSMEAQWDTVSAQVDQLTAKERALLRAMPSPIARDI